MVTDRRDDPPFGRPLYEAGRPDRLADLLPGPLLGALIGVLAGFAYGLWVGVGVGLLLAVVILFLLFADRGRRARRSKGDDSGDGWFDASSTRHFDACHSDGAGDGGGDSDGGGDGGGGGD